MDAADKLAGLRDRFLIPEMSDGQPVIYFCGNSLGLMPHNTREAMNDEIDRWQNLVIEGYWDGKKAWLNYQDRLAEPMARVVGALPEEVVVSNGLTVNLHLMMISFYRPAGRRRKILIEANAFPSDHYAAASHLRQRGFDPAETLLQLPLREGEIVHRHTDILDYINKHGEEIALVMPGAINYYTGQAFNIEEITALAHKKGCLVGWDLAHAAGNIPLSLHDWQADFAAWCTYKYLNSGPGSMAACFVHQKHHNRNDLQRLEGWWGNSLATRFQMEPQFDPDEGARAWQISCPPVLSLPPMEAALQIFDETDPDSLRRKSIQLTGYLEFLIQQSMSDRIKVITPENAAERGCQLSLVLEKGGKAIFDRLASAGIICDWREPDVIRVAPVPLYNTFREVWQFCEILKQLLAH